VRSIHPEENPFLKRISQRISPSFTKPWLPLALAVMMLVTYALDLMTPLGVPVWLLYFVPLLLSFWSRPYYALPTVCIVSMLFIVAGFVFSPPGIQTFVALLMRVIFSGVFISISGALWLMRRRMRRTEILQKA
jgi:hypothetical protein